MGQHQTGISYPKYYLWVKALYGKKVVLEGAATLAGDRDGFPIRIE
jgi:hypothetical protein